MPNGRQQRGRAPHSTESGIPPRELLLAEVATRYFVDGVTQDEISQQIGRSVATVSRMLSKAEESGIVEVQVRHPVPLVPALQHALAKRFDLRVARVVNAFPAEPGAIAPMVSEIGARFTTALLDDGAVITVGWGTFVRGVVSAIPSLPLRCAHVVQGLGSLGSRLPSVDNPRLIQLMAERLDATSHFLPAPMIVENAAMRETLAHDPHFSTALEFCSRSSVAIIGIGEIDPQLSGLCRAGYVEPWVLERIRAQGAVGDVMVEFFDLYGRILPTDIGPRVLGMREADLRNTGTVIAVAGGPSKTAAMLGALRSGMIHVLVTDSITARQVLLLADAHPAPVFVQGAEIGAHPTTAQMDDDKQRQVILDATWSVLQREGYQRFSIAAVSSEAGVPPQTIYRLWESRALLVFDAWQARAARASPPDGTFVEALQAILAPFDLFTAQGNSAGQAQASMMAEAQLDQEFMVLQRLLEATWREQIVAAAMRAQQAGELPRGAKLCTLADMLLGAIWYRLLLQHAAIDLPFLQEMARIASGRPLGDPPPAQPLLTPVSER